MMQKVTLVASAAFTLSVVLMPPAFAVTPNTGDVSCTLSGSAKLKPGLPLNSPGSATKPFKTKITFTGTLSNCNGTQSGTKKGLQIEGGSVTAKGTVVTAAGQPLPSCLGLATPPTTPTALKSTVKFTNSTTGKPKVIAKSQAVMTLGTPTLGPPISFETSGPVSKGAFVGQNVTAFAVLDLDAAGFAAACSASGGLTTLSFTGVQGKSTFVSP